MALDKVFAKNFVRQKLFLKKVLTNISFFAIITSVLNIGVSPSGKASDSDSDISGVRIPVPQPKRRTPKGVLFRFGWGTVASRTALRARSVKQNGVRI